MKDSLVYTLGKMQIDDKSAFVKISIFLIDYQVTIYENSIFNMIHVPYYWYIMQDFMWDRWFMIKAALYIVWIPLSDFQQDFWDRPHIQQQEWEFTLHCLKNLVCK